MITRRKITKIAGFAALLLAASAIQVIALEVIVLPPVELDPAPPPVPEIVTVAVTVNPETINLSSQGNFISVYITPPESYNPSEIDRSSVRLYPDGEGPVYALAQPWEVNTDGIMLKFDAAQLKSLLLPGNAVEFEVKGNFFGGAGFEGADTVRVIDPVNENPGAGNGAAGGKRNASGRGFGAQSISSLPADGNYRYSLTPIPEEASPVRAYVGQNRLQDVTALLAEKWYSGEKSLTLSVSGSDLNLYVEYSLPEGKEKEAAEKQVLTPVSARQQPDPVSRIVKVHYTREAVSAGKVSEKDLVLYGFIPEKNEWEPVPAASLNIYEKNITAPETGKYSLYRIMAAAPAPARTGAASSSLGQNYPNPFNPTTTIPFSVARDGHVTIRIYNMRGQLVDTILDGFRTAGSHEAEYLEGANLSRGVYYYQLISGDDVRTGRMAVR